MPNKFNLGYNLTKTCLSCQVNTQVQVYAVNYNTIATTFYSLNSTITTLPTLSVDLFSLLLAAPEYVRNKNLYGFVSLKAVTFRAISSTNQNAAISDLPPIYLDLQLGSTLAITNALNAFSADSALEMKPNNMGSGSSTRKYYAPGVIVGQSGYPVMGSSLFIATPSYGTSGAMQLVLGYGNAPTFTGAVNSATRIVIVDVLFDLDFSFPLFQTNV